MFHIVVPDEKKQLIAYLDIFDMYMCYLAFRSQYFSKIVLLEP